MKKVLYLLLALSIGLNAGLLIVQQSKPPRPGPGPRGGPPGERPRPMDPEAIVENHLNGMTRHLDLDEEQQQAIRMVLETHMPQLSEARRQLDEANRRISDAFRAPGFDPVTFKELSRQATRARSRADSLSSLMLIGEAAVLTNEQREKYAEVAPTVHSGPQRNQPPPRRRKP